MNPTMKKTPGEAKGSGPEDVSTVPPSEHTGDFTEEYVVGRATEVFANQQKAQRWLGTPVRALEYATPNSLLSRPDGRSAVLEILDKIEHGVL